MCIDHIGYRVAPLFILTVNCELHGSFMLTVHYYSRILILFFSIFRCLSLAVSLLNTRGGQ